MFKQSVHQKLVINYECRHHPLPHDRSQDGCAATQGHTSGFQPDYYAERVTQWHWTIYPWAIYKDISGFVIRILKKRPYHGRRDFCGPHIGFQHQCRCQNVLRYLCRPHPTGRSRGEREENTDTG